MFYMINNILQHVLTTNPHLGQPKKGIPFQLDEVTTPAETVMYPLGLCPFPSLVV